MVLLMLPIGRLPHICGTLHGIIISKPGPHLPPAPKPSAGGFGRFDLFNFIEKDFGCSGS